MEGEVPRRERLGAARRDAVQARVPVVEGPRFAGSGLGSPPDAVVTRPLAPTPTPSRRAARPRGRPPPAAGRPAAGPWSPHRPTRWAPRRRRSAPVCRAVVFSAGQHAGARERPATMIVELQNNLFIAVWILDGGKGIAMNLAGGLVLPRGGLDVGAPWFLAAQAPADRRGGPACCAAQARPRCAAAPARHQRAASARAASALAVVPSASPSPNTAAVRELHSPTALSTPATALPTPAIGPRLPRRSGSHLVAVVSPRRPERGAHKDNPSNISRLIVAGAFPILYAHLASLGYQEEAITMQFAPDSVVGGKYRLERPLSHGGMGSVWVARHVSLGSLVAVKFMDPTYAASSTFLARFEREARIAASLQSPHVVTSRTLASTTTLRTS